MRKVDAGVGNHSSVNKGEKGVLICCGKRLVWQKQEGTVVLEVTCENCGTTYAMDPGGDVNGDAED